MQKQLLVYLYAHNTLRMGGDIFYLELEFEEGDTKMVTWLLEGAKRLLALNLFA